MATRDTLRDKFAKYWNSHNLDVLICPSASCPPTPVEETHHWHVGGYLPCARVYNFLDYPAGIVTVTTVSPTDMAQVYDPDTDDPTMARAARAGVANSLGLPVSVQVVAAPWREELCLRAMLEIQ